MDDRANEGTTRFKAAMERVRRGESEAEEVALPSGRVRILPDQGAPNGVKIEVMGGEGSPEGGLQSDSERKEFFQRLKSVTEKVQSGELEKAEVELPSGETMILRSDPDVPGGFVAQAGDGGPAIRTIPFGASTTRPDGYPDDLPFLPDLKASLTTVSEGRLRTVEWANPPDGKALLHHLAKILENEGWMGEEPQTLTMPFGTTTVREFKRGEGSRALMLLQSKGATILKLMEKSGGEGPE